MHVLVTGASSGIGRSLAQAFAAEGYTLSLVARREGLLRELAAELGGSCRAFQGDLSDARDPLRWLRAAEEAQGPVDVLVNNAGISYVEPAASVDAARIATLFQVNVHTPIAAIHHVLPGMLERGAGAIVNVASNAAFTPAPGFAHYSATKGALGNFSEGLRMELRGSGVHVLSVYPGPVETPMADRNWEQLESTFAARLAPVGDPDTLARRVLTALRRRRARVIYPRAYALGWYLPGIARLLAQALTPPAKGHVTPPLAGDLVAAAPPPAPALAG